MHRLRTVPRACWTSVPPTRPVSRRYALPAQTTVGDHPVTQCWQAAQARMLGIRNASCLQHSPFRFQLLTLKQFLSLYCAIFTPPAIQKMSCSRHYVFELSVRLCVRVLRLRPYTGAPIFLNTWSHLTPSHPFFILQVLDHFLPFICNPVKSPLALESAANCWAQPPTHFYIFSPGDNWSQLLTTIFRNWKHLITNFWSFQFHNLVNGWCVSPKWSGSDPCACRVEINVRFCLWINQDQSQLPPAVIRTTFSCIVSCSISFHAFRTIPSPDLPRQLYKRPIPSPCLVCQLAAHTTLICAETAR